MIAVLRRFPGISLGELSLEKIAEQVKREWLYVVWGALKLRLGRLTTRDQCIFITEICENSVQVWPEKNCAGLAQR